MDGPFEGLYRSRFVHPNINFATLLEIYKICTLLHRSTLHCCASNFRTAFSSASFEWRFQTSFPLWVPTFAPLQNQHFINTSPKRNDLMKFQLTSANFCKIHRNRNILANSEPERMHTESGKIARAKKEIGLVQEVGA